jgi:hypothetical protein
LKVEKLKVAAICERCIPGAGDTNGNRHPRQAGTAIEPIVSNAGDTVANRGIGQAARGESKSSQGNYTVGNRHARQEGARIERQVSDAGDTVADRGIG